MNRVNLYRTASNAQTAISNMFIDEYMADANDAQLKIYLFLIRMLDANLPTSVSDIADKFNYTEKDVLRALMHWEARKLLSLDFDAQDNLLAIRVLSLESARKPVKESPRITPVLSFVRPASLSKPFSASGADCLDEALPKPEYSADELKDFKKSEDIRQLLMVAEQYMGRQLSHSDMETMLFICGKLEFSSDLADYLLQHCVERGKKDFRYIEKVALSWHEQGITSPKEAQTSMRRHDKLVYTIMKSLGKASNPAPKELEYIDKWTKEYGFPPDVIQEACDKTVMNTDTHRFAYADGILSKWHQAGVRRKADIEAADSSFKKQSESSRRAPKNDTGVIKNNFNRFTQNTYDFEELEQNILSN